MLAAASAIPRAPSTLAAPVPCHAGAAPRAPRYPDFQKGTRSARPIDIQTQAVARGYFDGTYIDLPPSHLLEGPLRLSVVSFRNFLEGGPGNVIGLRPMI